MTDFTFLGSKITPDCDRSHGTKLCLLLGRKAVTNLDNILKSRDITLPTNVCLVKAMFFPVVMYGCENWTIKKSEHQRIDAFELWCWRRLLRVSWTVRRSNQSILKEISPEYPLEGLMLKLKFQIRPPNRKSWLIGKDPDAGKDWRYKEKGMTENEMAGWASLTQWIWVWTSSRKWWRTGKPAVLQSMRLQPVRYNLATEQQQQGVSLILPSHSLYCWGH